LNPPCLRAVAQHRQAAEPSSLGPCENSHRLCPIKGKGEQGRRGDKGLTSFYFAIYLEYLIV